jgi:hypothetical protein
MKEFKCISFILESPFKDSKDIDSGSHNGYVAIPKEHPLFGKEMSEVYDDGYPLMYNGGITWSAKAEKLNNIPEGIEGMWVLGFDTSHSWDKAENWSEYSVKSLAEEMRDELSEIKN